ncbi:hypothetical protein Plav_0873 [Parvibaculum lavamentivorans DS-1]|uniref:Uncharacterized protein n=1 Tax=Parvibaculum lavamentivorans (strain DS-1 / DSM 13023 / NCIMB 13966) TaxID=402881 RepID=A7HRG3_PARL1|nr:hypothetical protein [Parvibaculum lavamentivorans]ABS62496.1 hypothetical protein Plav_0873 [Parvibaculum lavamentivorans DS-1]
MPIISTCLRAAFCGLLIAALPVGSAFAAGALLEGGTVTLTEGETASFPISGASNGPANLHAQCEIGDVNGTASLTFDGEHYVPLSEPAVGEVITLSGGDTRAYELTGVVDAPNGDAYIAFFFGGAPAAMCFPGMNCDGAEAATGSVTISCRNVAS